LHLFHSCIRIEPMELTELGFTQQFQDYHRESGEEGVSPARVTAVDRGSYLVRNGSGECLAQLSGRLAYSVESTEDLPAVGDWVSARFYNADSLAIIEDVFPRKSILMRKTAGKKVDFQVIAANIDVAFIVQSCDFNFNIRRLERYLVMTEEGDIEPAILLSKTDLVSRDELEEKLSAVREAQIKSEIIAVSSKTGAGLESVRQSLERGKTYCLLGSSGVGKTTLLNSFIGRYTFETSEVRDKDGRGRHTTARRQLVILDNGAMLVDTPGMRELGNIDVSDGIGMVFPDIAGLTGNCRFNDCSHTRESGCAVLKAIQDGVLNEDRYRSYLKLVNESEYHRRSYVEKREKDRKLGKFYRSVKKTIRKK